MKNRILSIIRSTIPYAKELRPIAGSVIGAILMQQLDYWFERYPEGFYKFTEPCPKNKLYKAGDSWVEELGISDKEFRTAFDKIGHRFKSKGAFNQSADPFQGKFYCSYHDNIRGLTFYLRNHPAVDTALDSLLTTNPCNRPMGSCGSPQREVALYTENTAKYSLSDASAMSPSAAQTDPTTPEGGKAASGTGAYLRSVALATYPDKLLTEPPLNPDKSNYVQPRDTVFEFEEQPASVGSALPGEDDDRATQPEQSRPELQDRIRKQKNVPPRSRQLTQDEKNRAYDYDASGWLKLPPANGKNSQAKAIAVRAMQEMLVTDYGDVIDISWEEDEDGFFTICDNKGMGESLSLDEVFGKKGSLPLRKLRDCCSGYSGHSGPSQDEYNRELQALYEIALEHCSNVGRLEKLEDGERWIDQPLFAEYLSEWLE